MITLSHDVRIWLCAGHTVMRKGFDGLSAIAHISYKKIPSNGHVFGFVVNAVIGLNYCGGMVKDGKA